MKATLKKFLTASVSAGLALLTACGGGGADIGKNIGETASKNLVEASKQLDVFGLKKLLEENEDLRKKLSEAQVLYQMSSGMGAVSISNQTLLFRVLDYSGDIKVAAMINGPSGRFINGERLTSTSVANVPFDAQRFFNERSTSRWSYAGEQGGEMIDFKTGPQLLFASVQAAFANYQSKTQSIPQTTLPEYKLNERFSESGMNKLMVEVTPLGFTTDNKWHFRGALILRSVNGAESTLATFRTDQQSNPEGLNKTVTFDEPLRVLLSSSAPQITASSPVR